MSKLPNEKAKILIVDDHAHERDAYTHLIEQRFNYAVCSPPSFDALKEAITFEIFDSVLVDVDLDEWNVPAKIDGTIIEDGTDIARFYFDLHKIKSGRLYSTHVKFPAPRFGGKIKRLLRKIEESQVDFTSMPKTTSLDIKEIEEEFKPVLEGAERVYKSNPLFRPISYYSGGHRAKRLRAYKTIGNLHSNWLNFNFESVGDCAWGVICGRSSERDYYSKSLVGDERKESQFVIGTRENYPTRDELNAIAEQRGALPFVVWNTRKLGFVERQFNLAGPLLTNVPDYLRDFFGIAMARSCIQAYESGRRDWAIEWCQQLTFPAQVEIAKAIFRNVRGKSSEEADLTNFVREANLPQIVEVYDCRVDGIEDAEDGQEQIAWVELRLANDYRAISMEPFDLKQLQNNDIDHDSQKFEYVVYRLTNDDVAMSIEPIGVID
ncbi:MAG TPA: response regulator [Pyrinomonadaceae bacterium]|nr:response regulator [Pyrinomonadaceae bacterium]